jgi:hypothetical protein
LRKKKYLNIFLFYCIIKNESPLVEQVVFDQSDPMFHPRWHQDLN